MTKPSHAIVVNRTIQSHLISDYARATNGQTTRQGQPVAEGFLFVGTIQDKAGGGQRQARIAAAGDFAASVLAFEQEIFDLREQHAPLGPAQCRWNRLRARDLFAQGSPPDVLRTYVQVQARHAALTREADCQDLKTAYRTVCLQASSVLNYHGALKQGLDITPLGER